MIKSQLKDIDGVGDGTVEKLIQSFGSVENIKRLTMKEIREVVGESKARKIYEALQ